MLSYNEISKCSDSLNIILYAKGSEHMNKRLIAYRKMLGLTQSEVAKDIGLSLSSYSRKESGVLQFSQSQMVTVTNFLKDKISEITMDEIFFNDKCSKLLQKTY